MVLRYHNNNDSHIFALVLDDIVMIIRGVDGLDIGTIQTNQSGSKIGMGKIAFQLSCFKLFAVGIELCECSMEIKNKQISTVAMCF